MMACVQNAPVIVSTLENSFSKPEEHFCCVIYIRTRRQSKYNKERTVSVRQFFRPTGYIHRHGKSI
jgi:hypothetical protein